MSIFFADVSGEGITVLCYSELIFICILVNFIYSSHNIHDRRIAMTIYDTDKSGNIIIVFDSRWRYPETLGYKPTDPEYAELQRLWEQATGEAISEKETADAATEVLTQTD